MKNRRILKEIYEPQLVQVKDPKLQTSINLGCFTSNDKFPVEKNGKNAIYRKATKPENASAPHIFFYADGTKEFRNEKDEVVRTTKWTCGPAEKKTNPELSPIMSDVWAIFDSEGWKLWNELSGIQIPGYTLVNLKDNQSDFPDAVKAGPYKDQFAALDFFAWKPTGLVYKGQNKNQMEIGRAHV